MTIAVQVGRLESENASLRETVARLTARVRFLEDLTNQPEGNKWRHLQLNPQERTMAVLLLAYEMVSRERALMALHGGQMHVDDKLVDVLMSRLRKKLPKGVTIKNERKMGWFIPDEGKRLLKNTLAVRTPSSELVPA